MGIKNNWEEIKDKIWDINKYYDYNPSIDDCDVLVNLTEITNLVESIQKEAYREGFKAAEEKFTSIGEVRITPDLLDFINLMEDENTGEKMLYLYETDELTKAAGIYTDAWHNDTYQISFYGVETNDNFKVIVTANVQDTEELKLRYPDVAGNILKISDAGEMEVAFNDKELEIIKAEFDKTVNEYKRADNAKKDRIKKELEYIKNPNMYIDVYNSYRDKSIAYPLAEYLDIKASQSGFDNYEDMLNEGLSIDYSGEYIKEPDKQHNNDDIELD